MNDFDNIVKRMTVTRLEPGDYTGEDGLLYCGKCRTPKQFRMDKPLLEGRLLPCPCQCEQERIDRETAEQEARRHLQSVADLKRLGFTDPAMRDWTFANDNGKCPPILEKEKDIEIDKDRELEKGGFAPAVLGRYQNIFLTDQERVELQTEFPAIWQEYIERLSEYMASTGKTYKSHAATIRRWIADDRRKAAPVVRDRDYSVSEGDIV